MQTSSRIVVVALFAGLASLALHCAAKDTCIRYSDCDEGLTCARGHCLPPPGGDSGLDAALEGAAPDGGAAEAGGDVAVSETGAPDGSDGSTDSTTGTMDAGDATIDATVDGASDDAAALDAISPG
jgi:hypothetical protein